MIPKAARARLQNIKISKYLETRRLTEDVFGESGRKPWCGDTPHAREPLTLKITVIFGFRTKIAVVAKYRAKITVHCCGVWLPYKITVVTNYRATITVHYRGGWLKKKNESSGFRTKIAVVPKYRAKITVHCCGFWLPYKNYCCDQIPCNNYRVLPW